MQEYVRLQEESRTSRRAIADALEVVHQVFGFKETPRGEVRVNPLRLPSGDRTALVDVLFPELDCIVSLPTSAQFQARSEEDSRLNIFEIARLDGAEVGPGGSVVLIDGIQLRAVEVVPTHLPYKPSELEVQILRHVIALTKSYHCYRSIREGLPEDQEQQVPDVRALDYARICSIEPPPLKVIQGYIAENDPELKVSNQKIADALAMCGMRIPRRRPRAG
jgi:hypothetical protein